MLRGSSDSQNPTEKVRCARDSDWCDGVMCRARGIFPDCPNADPVTEYEAPFTVADHDALEQKRDDDR